MRLIKKIRIIFTINDTITTTKQRNQNKNETFLNEAIESVVFLFSTDKNGASQTMNQNALVLLFKLEAMNKRHMFNSSITRSYLISVFPETLFEYCVQFFCICN